MSYLRKKKSRGVFDVACSKEVLKPADLSVFSLHNFVHQVLRASVPSIYASWYCNQLHSLGAAVDGEAICIAMLHPSLSADLNR